jgi:hypothetical protein
MPATPKPLFRGAATTTVTTVLYTVPASTNTIVTNIAVTNTATTSATFTLTLDTTDIHKTSVLNPLETVYIDLKQVLATTKTIKGGASAVTVNFNISGVEIT